MSCLEMLPLSLTHILFPSYKSPYLLPPCQWKMTKIRISHRISALWDTVRDAGWVIYSEASMNSFSAGWAFHVTFNSQPLHVEGGALTFCSSFVGEAYALMNALEHVLLHSDAFHDLEVIIRTNSMSVL